MTIKRQPNSALWPARSTKPSPTTARGLGAFRVHRVAICPELMRSAEISAAGQTTSTVASPWSGEMLAQDPPTGCNFCCSSPASSGVCSRLRNRLTCADRRPWTYQEGRSRTHNSRVRSRPTKYVLDHAAATSPVAEIDRRSADYLINSSWNGPGGSENTAEG